MKYDFAVMLQEYRTGGLHTRYFLSTHAVANILVMLASVASTAMGFLGQWKPQLLLLVVATLCAGQAIMSWGALQRQFKQRYSLR
ncbi:MAG TPA: hypothetical protein VM074_10540 [Solimonas sp.]|nr:hypothetical protein [Solimonas sp.]